MKSKIHYIEYANKTQSYIYATLVLIAIVDSLMFLILPLSKYIYFGSAVIFVVIIMGIWYYFKFGSKKQRENMKVFFFNSASSDKEAIRNLENSLDKYRTEAKLNNKNILKLLTGLMILYDYYTKKENDVIMANRYKEEALQILNSEDFPSDEEANQVRRMAENLFHSN
jgi:hypothetical protein